MKISTQPNRALVKKASLIIAIMGIFVTFSHSNDAMTISKADKAFMRAAAQGGMLEVRLGQMAAEKGMREDVKDFGSMMVKDHGAMGDDLKSLANQKGVTLPDSLDAKHQAIVNKLDAVKATKFDKIYIAEMIKDHKADAKAFKAESTKTKDGDIKVFLDKSIPVVEEHLRHVITLKK